MLLANVFSLGSPLLSQMQSILFPIEPITRPLFPSAKKKGWMPSSYAFSLHKLANWRAKLSKSHYFFSMCPRHKMAAKLAFMAMMQSKLEVTHTQISPSVGRLAICGWMDHHFRRLCAIIRGGNASSAMHEEWFIRDTLKATATNSSALLV